MLMHKRCVAVPSWARIYELAVTTGSGQLVSMQQLAGSPRVDLRFGADNHGKLYILSKANGKIWELLVRGGC
jgi:hypothetical protein